MTNTIAIKGTREGLTITLGAGELDAMLDDLSRHLEVQGAFFRGGNVALQADDLAMSLEDLTRVMELLGRRQMVLRTVVAGRDVTREAADALGLRVITPEAPEAPAAPHPQGAPVAPALAARAPDTRAMLIRQIVRSGQVIRGSGHVVVIGDVNPGGEIVAAGDVVVWGRLRGIVHAGAMGNDAASVYALRLTPMQLRIGEHVARPADNETLTVAPNATACPEVATVRDGIIVIEPWDRGARGR